MTESDKHMYRMLKSGAHAFSAQTISAHAASGPAFCAGAMPPKPKTYPAGNGQRAPGVAGSPSGLRTKALHHERRNPGQRRKKTRQNQWVNVERGGNETTASGQFVKRIDAAGKTSARPGNPEGGTDFDKENGEPLGQEIRGQTCDSTDKVIHDLPSPHADASLSLIHI